jgi:hypothetical protein
MTKLLMKEKRTLHSSIVHNEDTQIPKPISSRQSQFFNEAEAAGT